MIINLLPPEQKKEIRAGRANLLLLRYCVLTGVVVTVLCLAIALGYLYLSNTKNLNEARIAENNLKSKEFANVEAESKQFKSNLTIARRLLDKKVTYAKVYVKLSNTMPEGTALESFMLDPTLAGQRALLSARVKTPDHAIQVRKKLIDTGLFKEVPFATLKLDQQKNAEGKASDYPYLASYNLIYTKEAIQ